MLHVNLEQDENGLNDTSKTELVRSAHKSWLKQGWAPKTGLNKHRLFLTKSQTSSLLHNNSIINDGKDLNLTSLQHNKEYQTVLTQTLYGDPTSDNSTSKVQTSSQSSRAKLLQNGSTSCAKRVKNDEKARNYILGACELFPETPVLVDFTQFSIFENTGT